MKTAIGIAFQALFLAAIYYGFVENMEGPRNLAKGIAWIHIFLTIGFLSKTVMESMKDDWQKYKAWRMWINLLVDIIVIGSFAWFGSWVISTLYFVHTLITFGAVLEARK